eukprot:m51a1_g136 hypothetical protein (135) ;mRNA; r:447518-448323
MPKVRPLPRVETNSRAYSFCCPCYQYGINVELSDTIVNGSSANAWSNCCTWSAFCLFLGGPYLVAAHREILRDKYRIKGSFCDDCCVSIWCLPCVLSQIGREVLAERGGFAGRCEDIAKKYRPEGPRSVFGRYK